MRTRLLSLRSGSPAKVAALGAVAVLAALAALPACSDNGTVTYGTQPGDDAGLPDHGAPGLGVGDACDATNVCRAGLACTNGKCAPAHVSPDGAMCTISDECKLGSICGPARTCVASGGMSGVGDGCKTDADCQPGLRCNLQGIGLECQPEGTKDLGGACSSSPDCLGGLACVAKVCAPNPPPGLPPAWPGADCKDDSGPTQAYFRVPRGAGDGDFYRLPFPNDVRLKNGHPDLSGHPTPGPGVLGFDAVDRYLRYVEESTDGFSAYPTVFFRFSAAVDFDSLKLDGAIHWYDVTGGQAIDVGYGWTATTARNAYLCANPLKLRPPAGAPLLPGHMYAVVLSTQVVDANKKPLQRSPDLAALLDAQAPQDPALAAAYAAYKPLRDLAAAKMMPTASILDATVFTVAHATEPARKTAAAVAKAPLPSASGWIKCDGATPSPCPQAKGGRACPTVPDPAFDELHALVALPIFQKGSAPYLTPADGGDFEYAADGTPNVQRTEQVCLALTVPKGAPMPASGWPVVLYAHGTGGSFRSAIDDGVAARLASLDDGTGGAAQHIAVLGIDQVEHGPRRGASTSSPNDLFFNFGNPLAARGNALQGAADQLALARFAKAFDLAAAQSPTGTEIKLGALAFWGHSQGATEGGIALAYDATIAGAVLSGEGASLIDALLTKKSPVDVADALPIALQDPAVDEFHPVLGILQNAIDPVDPLNHALGLVLGSAAAPPGSPKHIFQPLGQNDTFAPPITEKTFAIAAGLAMAAPPAGVTLDPISDVTPLPVPAGGNVSPPAGTLTLTAVVREYAPSGYDGHFVAYKDAAAARDVNLFLSDVLSGKTPKIGR